MREQFTPKQVARAIGVSDASLKRWCDKGLIPYIRTAGGHRRLLINGVIEFLRRSGHPLIRPEVLGLPPITRCSEATLERVSRQMIEALQRGDEEQFRRLGFNLYLAGHSVCAICDQTITPAFHEIGRLWESGQVSIYQERRACLFVQRFLTQIRVSRSLLPAAAPVAIGGTIEDDPYTLPTTMVEAVLREAGWRAESYGSGLPLAALQAALEDVRPRLFWLSISSIAALPEFLDHYHKLYNAAAAHGVALVVGGRALTDKVRCRMRYSMYCDNLCHLTSFAQTLYQPAETRVELSPAVV